MKRRVFLLLSLCVLLCGCFSDPLQADEGTEAPVWSGSTQPTEFPVPPETRPTEPESPVKSIEFLWEYDLLQESCALTAYGSDGQVVWTYHSPTYPMTQLPSVSDIGGNDGKYYIVEQGSILALDWDTGEILWKNDEFIGSPANQSCAAFDEAGTLYICGYFGPDFFAVDKDGNTVKRIEALNSNYFWPFSLTLSGDWITVALDGGEEGDLQEPYTAYVNKAYLRKELSASEAAVLAQRFYNETMGAEGTYVAFEEECQQTELGYTVTLRYQLSDREAQEILDSGGIPEANVYAATVTVTRESGSILP